MLSTLDLSDIDLLMGMLNKEQQLVSIKDKIENKVRGDLDKAQRDFLRANEAIQMELDESGEEDELEQLKTKVAKAGMPEETEDCSQEIDDWVE